MVAVKMGFGMSRITGRMVSVREVVRGKACQCVCAECGASLEAKQGPKNTWHFAHKTGGHACITGAETALHRMAKQIVAGWAHIVVPELQLTETLEARFHTFQESASIPSRSENIVASAIEMSLGSFRPDALVRTAAGDSIALEIHVSHAVDAKKGQRVRDANQGMLEYDLSRVEKLGLSADELDRRLRSLTPTWVHHPGEAGLRTQLQHRLAQRALDEENARQRRIARIVEQRRICANAPAVVPQREPYRTSIPPARVMGTLWHRSVEVRLKDHPLLEGLTIWAMHSDASARLDALVWAVQQLRDAGVTCTTHTKKYGYVMAWGQEALAWARKQHRDQYAIHHALAS